MKRLTPAATVALLAAWATLLLVTHHASRSPYTYISELTSEFIDLGRVAAPDALTVLPVTRFFYDGTPPADYAKAHNLWLPLHSFAAAIGLSFVRNYLWANSLVNLLFLVILAAAAVRFGIRHGLRPPTLLLGMATLFALPPVVACIGQPLHYIVAPAITFLMMLAAMALDEDDLRNPWIAGALTAVLTLNYHWYAFVAALVVYLALIRFRRRLDDVLFVFVAAPPAILWEVFLRFVTAGQASTTIRNALVLPVLYEWSEFLRHPLDRVMMPLIATHVGAAVAFHQVISLIHWPLLFALIVALWTLRPRVPRLLVLLVLFFVLEQLASAAFDFENSPRRAFPFLFAFACAYCWSVDRLSQRRAWLAVFIALFAFTSFFAFADVALDRGGGAFLYVGEAIQLPKDAMRYEARTLPREPSGVARDPQTELRAAFPSARFHFSWPFVIAQIFVAFWMTIAFWIAARARLLPRAAPWIAAGVWAVSLLARSW
ncbi:MAG TPA: hypothetical protein VM733_06495 [Thermoanaerobaculia bacterium]|nr:hypothetical protein [Thermoanaerobaculia bacterium]